MINSKIVLVPIDFSKCSFKNLQNAVDLAKTFKYKLVVLHVISMDEQLAAFCSKDKNADAVKEKAKKRAFEMMDNMKREIPELKYIEHEFKIREGVAYSEILKEVKDSKADVLVIGAKGLSDLNDFIYGSVTEKVIKKSPITTIITRKNA